MITPQKGSKKKITVEPEEITEGRDLNYLIRPLTLFFFLALMNEEKAISETTILMERLRRSDVKENFVPYLISRASEVVYQTENLKTYITKNINEKWILPNGLDIGPWKEFHKKVSKEEMISLLWSHVIKFTEQDVLRGLMINKGTHHYRISNALKKLGDITFSINN
ncbi:MAG: hypothetical protein L6Q37_08310 [Bdellovibrionaceae bacterium]|nr:hypothetical protein [Pseudobdellovibrionaceae bacterium]NUM57688.1 hypothetical protein [Pseudobdellovibrionaceae bacterium]